MLIKLLVIAAITAVFSNMGVYSNDIFLYKEAPYNQSNTLVLNMSISVTEFEGILAYILITQKNSRYISIVMKFDEEDLQISFNGVKKESSVSLFCKCTECIRKKLQFVVSYFQSNITFACNGNRLITFDKHSFITNEQDLDKNIYPFPARWNETQNIFAWIGNVGLFSQWDKTWPPMKFQLKGCVEHLQIGAEDYLATSNYSRCGSDVRWSGCCILLVRADVTLTTKYSPATTSSKYAPNSTSTMFTNSSKVTATSDMSTLSTRTMTGISSSLSNNKKENTLVILIAVVIGVVCVLLVVITTTMVMVFRIKSTMKTNVAGYIGNASVCHYQTHASIGTLSQGYGIVSDDLIEYEVIGSDKVNFKRSLCSNFPQFEQLSVQSTIAW